MGARGWIGVDLDGTLAKYDGWKAPEHIGEPVPLMVQRVRAWIAQGREVRIFTARAWPFYRQVLPGESLMTLLSDSDFDRSEFAHARRSAIAIAAIRTWCETHIGRQLPVTCVKDMAMTALWDDRAVQVWPNEGRPIGSPEDDPLGYEMGG